MEDRDINAEVATKIMGWVDVRTDVRVVCGHPAGLSKIQRRNRAMTPVANYSGSIESAMKVVEKMREKGFLFTLKSHYYPDEGAQEWSANFYKTPNERHIAIAPIPERAIVLAALAAINGDVEK